MSMSRLWSDWHVWTVFEQLWRVIIDRGGSTSRAKSWEIGSLMIDWDQRCSKTHSNQNKLKCIIVISYYRTNAYCNLYCKVFDIVCISQNRKWKFAVWEYARILVYQYGMQALKKSIISKITAFYGQGLLQRALSNNFERLQNVCAEDSYCSCALTPCEIVIFNCM